MTWVPYATLWGFVIRSSRRSAGVQQRRLAIALGIGQSGLAKIEKGIVAPTVLQVAIVADTLAPGRPGRHWELNKRVERLRRRCTEHGLEVRLCKLPVREEMRAGCVYGARLEEILWGLAE